MRSASCCSCRFGGAAVEAKYGQGAGVVECESFSGDLILTERGR